MKNEVKIIKKLMGEFVTAEIVKNADQKDYNQRTWNDIVNRYCKYEDVKFLKVPGTIYSFDYWVTYVADGIRFLKEVSYGSSLSNSGFTYGFITNGMKDKEAYEKVIKIMPELVDCDKDSYTIMSYPDDKRLPNDKVYRDYMRLETKLTNRFFTNCF